MIKKIVLQSIIYSIVFLFLFSFAFAQSTSNDNTLNCGPNQFLTIGSDGLKCASINLGNVGIAISLSSLSPVCVNGIRELQVVDEDDEGLIKGIVPTCVVIPVCGVNEILSYTDDFKCIDIDTFSGTFCEPNEILRGIEIGLYKCIPFLELDDNPGPGPGPDPVPDCKVNQFVTSFDEEGNPICGNFPERTITVENSPFANVRSINVEGINCGNGGNNCFKSFLQDAYIELQLDIIPFAKKLENISNGACRFIRSSIPSLTGYECAFYLEDNLTLDILLEDLKTFFTYQGPRKYEGVDSTSNTANYRQVGKNDPFCIDVQATHFPDSAIFVSTVTTRYRYKKGNDIRKFFKGRKFYDDTTTKVVNVRKENTITNTVRETIRVEEDRYPEYETWIAGDKICSTRGGYSHDAPELSYVGFDTAWTVDIRRG